MQPFNSFFFGGKPRRSSVAATSHFDNARSLYVHDFAPLGDWKSHPIYFNHLGYAAITHLFDGGCPITIGGFIISIIINPVERMAIRRSLSHVRKETGKVIQPSLTNRYSPFSISRIFFVFRIITALFHSDPSIVLRRMTHGVRSAIMGFSEQICGCLFGEASAAKCCFSYVSGCCRSRFAAIANTSPKGIASTWNGWYSLYHQQPTKPFPFKIKGHFAFSVVTKLVSLIGSWDMSMEKSIAG
jgi:hypothetical protein